MMSIDEANAVEEGWNAAPDEDFRRFSEYLESPEDTPAPPAPEGAALPEQARDSEVKKSADDDSPAAAADRSDDASYVARRRRKRTVWAAFLLLLAAAAIAIAIGVGTTRGNPSSDGSDADPAQSDTTGGDAIIPADGTCTTDADCAGRRWGSKCIASDLPTVAMVCGCDVTNNDGCTDPAYQYCNYACSMSGTSCMECSADGDFGCDTASGETCGVISCLPDGSLFCSTNHNLDPETGEDMCAYRSEEPDVQGGAMTSGFVESNGQMLYHEVVGQGPPLVLVMGIGYDSTLWSLYQVPALSKHFQVITFDNRDAGQSSKATSPYTIGDMAGDLEGLLSSLGIDRAHVLGASMGGMIAMEFAIRYPERVDKLVLTGTSAATGKSKFDTASIWSFVKQHDSEGLTFAAQQLLWLFSTSFLRNHEAVDQTLQLLGSNPNPVSPEAYARQADAYVQHDCLDELSAVTAKTMVISGEQDKLQPPWICQEIADAIPGARFELVSGDGASHALMLERPDEFNSIVIEFLLDDSPASELEAAAQAVSGAHTLAAEAVSNGIITGPASSGSIEDELATAATLVEMSSTTQAEEQTGAMSRGFIHSNGQWLYHEVAGQGPPLVLVMGIGYDSTLWSLYQVPALSKHFQVITFDNRDAGQSSKATSPYTIGDMADDLEGLLSSLGIDRAHVLGTSMGGMIAMEFAIRYPERVDKLVLTGTSAATAKSKFDTASIWSFVKQHDSEGLTFAAQQLLWLFSTSFLRNHEAVNQTLQLLGGNPNPVTPEAYARQADAYVQHDCLDELSAVTAKTMVISGEQDKLQPPWICQEIADAIPGARFKLVSGDGASHALMLERPDEFNSIVIDFLLE